jgi:peptidoglycan hydrolase-like protein with peptidoglycan-binding domain
MLAGAAVLVAVIGVVTTSGGEDAAPAEEDQSANTATVERGPLSNRVSRAGFLTYRAGSGGLPLAVTNRAAGTYTKLPALGDRVVCGEVLYRVDEKPVLLLCGAVPAYRDLHQGDAGEDVRQLNQNLHELGYDADIDIDPADGVFSSRTEAALRVLQQTKGFEVTGALGVDDAVVLPWSLRIAEVTGELGGTAEPGAQVLRATSDTLEVQIELDASEREAVKPGDAVQITLPGNTSATGTVDRLGRIAQAPDGPDADAGDATIGAYISLDHPEEARGLDKAPVQVEIAAKGVEDALSVPVTAIFGKSGGGFAVEVVRDGGRRELVAVELGLFDTAGGRVQVDGDVREGDRVVVPPS